MSILWLEPFIFDPTQSNIFTFESLNIVIYLNMVSIVCFVIYCLIYKMDLNMQKPPSKIFQSHRLDTLIIWKMFGECLVSIHFLLLFLCFAVENNKRKLEQTKYIMLVVSIISPVGIFTVYFFTACIAQNLYTTFHTYKNDFEKRMRVYKIYALIGGIIVLILSIVFNHGTRTVTNAQFSINFYPFFYIAFIYFAGAIGILFIICKTVYVINRKAAFFSFLSQNSEGEDNFKNQLVSLFIKRHLTFCYIFIICYLPNNIILVLQIFLSYKICVDCRIFAFAIYLISLSCTFSFIIKMTEPYTKKYLKLVISYVYKREDSEPEGIDYSTLYNNSAGSSSSNLVDNPQEMAILEKRESSKQNEGAELIEIADTIEIVTREMQTNDFYKTLIGIILSLHEDMIYDTDSNFDQMCEMFLPWEAAYYTDKSKFILYNNKNIPDWLVASDDILDIKNFNVKIRKYAPMVSHHLRTIDHITIQGLIESLDPNKNLKIIKDSFASGGRSCSPIIFTHDKKFLLKTIAKEEKDIMLKMLPEYHRRMRDCTSFICRMYGIFRVIVSDKQDAHVLIMRNMNELPSETRIAAFDLKGSTVDRCIMDKKDKELLQSGKSNEVLNKYRKTILKDIDFELLGFSLNFSQQDSKNIQPIISSDSEFLRGYNLIDYSLLVSVHRYHQEDQEKCEASQRFRIFKSPKYDYLFCISIIDFLTEYDMSKKFEHGIKAAGAIVSVKKDRNFSVQDAFLYSRRFMRFINHQLQSG